MDFFHLTLKTGLGNTAWIYFLYQKINLLYQNIV